jgi:hypothetical protein
VGTASSTAATKIPESFMCESSLYFFLLSERANAKGVPAFGRRSSTG